MKRLLCVIVFTLLAALAHAQISLNLYPDSTHAPFIYGVTSGDPTDSSLIIWTAVQDDTTGASQQVIWQLASDSTFTTILQSDSLIIDRSTGYTAHIDVQHLLPFTPYCYRFMQGSNISATGFTQTAPDQAVDSLKFGLVSCSSLFSGYFNAYRQIAADHTINAIIHVGDFIYDYADSRQLVRIPTPAPVEPVTLEDWRNRYRLYMLDPDQREARRRHPWIEMWDNHDVSKSHNGEVGVCTKAYFDFGPVRRPSAIDTTRIWRSLSYGPLAEIFVVDDYQYAGNSNYPSGNPKMLSDDQYQWLTNSLDSSRATWKILAVSKFFCQWNLDSINLPGGGLGSSWQGYHDTRDSLLIHIAANHINNPVIVSGDLHMDIVSDVVIDPFDSLAYDKATGAGALGVEVNGNSVTRINLTEYGYPTSIGPGLVSASYSLNPQQRFLDLFDHGYALLTFNSDSLISRMQACPILYITDTQTTKALLYCKKDENHWERHVVLTDVRDIPQDILLSVSPNPSATGQWTLRSDQNILNSLVEITNLEGQLIDRFEWRGEETPISISGASGLYFLRVLTADGTHTLKLVKL